MLGLLRFLLKKLHQFNMVNLHILCVILSLFKSSNTAAAVRNYLLSDLAYSSSDLVYRATNANKTTAPEVHYVDVNSKDNKSQNEYPGYGEEWVYVLHTDEGQAEWLDLTTGIMFEPQEVLADRSVESVTIQLYTRRNKENPESLTVDPYFEKPVLRSEFFDPTKRTKILTHGWSPEKIGLEEFQNLTSTYLELGDFNVIFVTWSAVSSEEFMLPVLLFPYVSRKLSVVIKAIIDTHNYKQDMHLIGHGVGAHIMGYAAQLADKNIARITGLDPERPFFEKPKSKYHLLGKNDARFVDIIHTCKGIRGYSRPHGHVDFYPNMGKSPQPGCAGYPVLQETCSHFRALFYFLEALTTQKHFYSYKCKNFKSGKCDKGHTLMGERAFDNVRGAYYLDTNNTEPYAVGKHVYLAGEPSIDVNITDSNPPDDCDEENEEFEEEEDGKEEKPKKEASAKKKKVDKTRQGSRDTTPEPKEVKEYESGNNGDDKSHPLVTRKPKLLEPLKSLNAELTKIREPVKVPSKATAIPIVPIKQVTVMDITL